MTHEGVLHRAALRSVAVALLLTTLSLAALAPPGTSITSRPTTIAYFPLSSGELADATAHGVVVTEDYGGFVVASVDSLAREYLDSRKAVYHDVDTLVGRGAYDYDPLGATTVPLEWQNDASRLRLVQFVGPVKPVWEQAVAATGAQVLARYSPTTLLVEAGEDVVPRLHELAQLRWTGAYHPGFRLAPQLLDGTYAGEVRLVSHKGRTTADLVAAAGAAGCAVTASWTDPTGPRARCVGNAAAFRALAFSDALAWAEIHSGFSVPNAQTASRVIQGGTTTSRDFYDRNIHGAGQVVGLLDSGISMDAATDRPRHVAFDDPQGSVTFNQKSGSTHRKVLAYLNEINGVRYGDEGDDGDLTGHGTAMAGIIAGDVTGSAGAGQGRPGADDGVAPAAKLVVVDLHDASLGQHTLREAASRRDALQAAYDAGARVLANSRGVGFLLSNTPYALVPYPDEAQEIDAFAHDNPDALLLYSAGNAGLSKLNVEAQAKNVLTVGALLNPSSGTATADRIWESSGTGPTSDNRVKPDLLAPGHELRSTTNAGAETYGPVGMTSAATAAASGGMALLREYYADGWHPTGTRQKVDQRAPTAALLRATAVTGAAMVDDPLAFPSDRDGNAVRTWPNAHQGWGRMDLGAAAYFDADARRLVALEKAGLAIGQAWDETITVTDPAQPLHVTVAWTDCAGQPGKRVSLCSDVQLIVVAPNGAVYVGNNYAAGTTDSVPGGAMDLRNVYETVRIRNPAAGDWRVHVVPEQGVRHLALVATGAIDHASLNRAPYETSPVSGPTSVAPGSGNAYKVQTTGDRDTGEPVAVEIDWGDGKLTRISNLTATPLAPLEVTVTKSFAREGTYQVRGRTNDTSMATSLWSTPLSVTAVCTPTTCLVGGGGGGGGSTCDVVIVSPLTRSMSYSTIDETVYTCQEMTMAT